MLKSLVIPSVLFAMAVSASSNLSIPAASNHKATGPIVLSQTGGDPEPITPPGPVGH